MQIGSSELYNIILSTSVVSKLSCCWRTIILVVSLHLSSLTICVFTVAIRGSGILYVFNDLRVNSFWYLNLLFTWPGLKSLKSVSVISLLNKINQHFCLVVRSLVSRLWNFIRCTWPVTFEKEAFLNIWHLKDWIVPILPNAGNVL